VLYLFFEHYISQNCSQFCSDSSTCSSQGFCTSNGTCQCDTKYYGDNCQFTSCPICVHGTCNNQTGICECVDQYFGLSCNLVNCSMNCNFGQCDKSSGICVCDQDYYGSACATFCSCDGDCDSNGNCVPGNTTWIILGVLGGVIAIFFAGIIGCVYYRKKKRTAYQLIQNK
jgi:hypothetical protein